MGLIQTLRDVRRNLRSTDGVRWAFCKSYVIPDVADPSRPYLTRLRIIQTPLFALYLHKIHLPDGDRALHDHPFPFASLILKGGYTEEYIKLARKPSERGLPGYVPRREVVFDRSREGSDRRSAAAFLCRGQVVTPGPQTLMRTHRAGSFNVQRTTDAHRIRTTIGGKPVWSLVFVGPRTRDWGFWTDSGFVPNKQYIAEHKYGEPKA